MVETYTYTARSAEQPERVVTFTLRDSRLSVSTGAPLEQVERAIQIGRGEDWPAGQEIEERTPVGAAEGESPSLWLRPLAISVIERGTRPIHVDDVMAQLTDDWLHVRAWVRAGGLRLVPVTLIDGRVDNSVAARDFVNELHERKSSRGLNVLNVFDYWATWIAAVAGGLLALQLWRKKDGEASQA
jgi:hypothetical protein